MKLKKISYPTLSQVKKMGSCRSIVDSSPYATISIGYTESANSFKSGKCIRVRDNSLVSGWGWGRYKYFNLTEEGYRLAKEEFERLTLEGISSLVEKWIELE